LVKQATGVITGADGLRPIDYVKISLLGIGLSALWANLHTLIIPLRLLDFVPESQKNTYLGLLTFVGLIVAMIIQPFAGAISDRCDFNWGRRRPFILLGALSAVPILLGMGLASSFIVFFVLYFLLQTSCNVAEGPFQGFIPDLVLPEKRGLASGTKTLLQAIGGLALIGLIGHFLDLYSEGKNSFWLWASLGVLATVLLGSAIVTVLTVRECPRIRTEGLSWLPNLRTVFEIDTKANRDFIWFLVSRGLIGIPGIMLQTFALYYLSDVLGITNPAVTANLMIVVGVSFLIVVFPAGRLSDKLGRKPVVISGALLGAFGVLLFFFSRSNIFLMISGAILGVANGTFASASWALATDLAPKTGEARSLGLVNLASAGGSALARLIGPGIDFFNGYRHNLGYSLMLVLAFGCYAAGSLVLLRVKERLTHASG
jgi:Na+/melibiose symporter-like transporter